MKNIFNLFNRYNKNNSTENLSDNIDKKETTDLILIKQYKEEIKVIKIENQPFRLSGLLHILTNKVVSLLKEKGHTIYYDVDNKVGRYIVGDNAYIEQVLEILIKDAFSLKKDSEVMVKVFNYQNKFLVFDIINEKGVMKKELYGLYHDVKKIVGNQSEQLNRFAMAKIIADTMDGSLVVKSTKKLGTHYTFKIPYYEDKDDRSHQDELKKYLAGKRALFIGKDQYDTKRTQYIFETYGIRIDNMQLSDFENKKPNLSKYDMAIIRSADLSYKHISFFKNIFQNEKSEFKIIIVHELFENKEKMSLSKPIAHAELYNPTVIGDVEEILYQMFILKSKAVKGINNIEVFNAKGFVIEGDTAFEAHNTEYYKGAHVAIVEDSKIDEKILKNILMKEDITLFCMHNGSEMIELLESEEIDIIFTDINMPVMDGILMTKKIRTMKNGKNIPIISVSSMAFSHELKKMELAGMNAAIAKPIEAKNVYMALKKFLIMNDKIRMRKNNKSQIHFLFKKEILDISKGVITSKSNLEYLEKLLKTMDDLRETRGTFEDMIYNQEFIALGEYARSALALYETIYASNMIKMFKDLNYFISQQQSTYLLDYIEMYKKNWKDLEDEVEKYIQSI
jgi:CheY-like chemotaxis protein